MKILKLKFRNINSLAGEHQIDFTLPAITHAGIFAIVGKTASGKTSILDAITLGLYGRTPRVSITEKENPVMTKGEKDCFVEITFEANGRIWTASWQQEYNRKGGLKPVSRRLVDSYGLIIADQIKDCNAKIIEILGLNFEQFTKVIMLPQFNFAAFLQAEKNDKGELLEQITGTEIYGEISRKVFERAKQEKEKLERIEKELDNIKTFTEEEHLNHQQSLEKLQEDKRKIEKTKQSEERALLWLKELNSLEYQLEENLKKLPDLQTGVEESKNRLEEVNMLLVDAKEQLRSKEPIFNKVRELDTRCAEKEDSLKKTDTAIHNLEQSIQATQAQILELETHHAEVIKQWNEKKHWANQHLSYEGLVTHFSALKQEHQLLKQRAEQILNLDKELTGLNKNHQSQVQILEGAHKRLEQIGLSLNEKEEALRIVQEKLQQLLSGKDLAYFRQLKEKNIELTGLLTRLIETQEALLTEIKNKENCSDSLQQIDAKLNQLLPLMESQKNILHQVEEEIQLLNESIRLTHIIQSLEEHRRQLKDGEPCPLCGSPEHPYAKGNIPALDPFKAKLEAAQKRQNELYNENQRLQIQLATLNSNKENLLHRQKISEEALANNTRKRESLLSQLSEFQIYKTSKQIYAELSSLEELKKQQEVEKEYLSKIIDEAQRWEKKLIELRDREIPSLQKENKEAENYKTSAEIQLTQIESSLQEKTRYRDELFTYYQKDKTNLQQKYAQYGARSINQLEQFLSAWQENTQQLDQLSKQATELQHQIQLRTHELEKDKSTITERQTERKNLNRERQILLEERRSLLGDTPVDKEESRLKQNLVEAEQSQIKWQGRNHELSSQLEKLKAIIEKVENDIRAKKQLQLTHKTREELEEELPKLNESIEKISQEMGSIRAKLERNEADLALKAQKIKEKQKQEEIYRKWETLNTLIGSSDGKKYRNYAQSLTFEYLVKQANEHLKKLSTRYILKRMEDEKNPFGLEVIDKYQNGEIRSVDNLSGGEKFIVSLSLALSLSQIISKNVHIDSLFIDEGFGTLDSDYLDIALSALSNLQSEGKIIGVISHLTELKERIPTHIEVIPVGSGHSSIRIEG